MNRHRPRLTVISDFFDPFSVRVDRQTELVTRALVGHADLDVIAESGDEPPYRQYLDVGEVQVVIDRIPMVRALFGADVRSIGGLIRELRRRITDHRPDVVLYECLGPGAVAVLGAMRATGAPLRTRLASPPPESDTPIGALGQLFLGSERVSCPSQAMVDEWTRRQPELAGRASVVHEPLGAHPSVAADPTTGRLVTAGRLHPVKGFDVLLEALARLAPRRPHLTIIGDGDERAALEATCHRLGIADHVTFAGWMSRDDVFRTMANASIMVVPSVRGESYGMVALEAQAVGLAVVASDLNGLPEASGAPECAVLVPPGDPAALATALARLLDDPTLASTVAARGRARMSTYDSVAVAALVEFAIG
jgi:glycosyltransferase involved in cell wall biosynthesis